MGQQERKLYDYQVKAIDQIFKKLACNPSPYNLVYQLPTGGGKTVIFSEIAKRYLVRNKDKKIVILTHRVELCRQTSATLSEIAVRNKVIDAAVKELDFQDEYQCFVAMVETLKNRIIDDKLELENIGMVIVDEAHYNSFRKLFKFFSHATILGVTATPLSSNMRLPMHEIYNDLIVGEPISNLVKMGFLARANTYTRHVSLENLKIGISGDYTVKSSEQLYSNPMMQDKLLGVYRERSLGRKTLIFNNGIKTSVRVYENFNYAGYPIKHLDNTASKEERRKILKWFRETPDAILTSVGILTTGFDEPTIETIIINRATRSLTLYYQMIGRGSRIFGEKKEFTVLDLGNNVSRFGLWGAPMDWRKIFHKPYIYLDTLKSDEAIERDFVYKLPDEVRKKFANSEEKDMTFDVARSYQEVVKKGEKSKRVLDASVLQHAKMCCKNSKDIFEARALAVLLKDDISYRIKRYSYCIIKSSKNYVNLLQENYERDLFSKINEYFYSDNFNWD